jgi:hypothetical protein
VAIGETDKRRRIELKKALLEDVITFCAEDVEMAKSEFLTSAAEVIAVLKEMKID